MTQVDTQNQELRLSEDEFRAVGSVARTVRYLSGETIFSRGEVGDCMYVVLDGEVEIRFCRDLPVKRLSSGSMFGELALIVTDHFRTAAAVTLTATELAVVDEAHFDRLIVHEPQVLISVMRRVCRYLINSEQRLVQELRERNRKLEQTLDFLRVTRKELDYQELLAQTDSLTGLYNRRCLHEQLPQFLARNEQCGEKIALILVDLDRLKPLNDSSGHAAGDRFISGASAAIRRAIRGSDLACRHGGDEFAIVIPDVQIAEARRCAEIIRKSIAALTGEVRAVGGWQASASLGCASSRPDDSAETLLERADDALYVAKAAGGNGVVWAADDST